MKDRFFHKNDRQNPEGNSGNPSDGGGFRKKKYYFNKNRKKPRMDGSEPPQEKERENPAQDSSRQRNFSRPENSRNGFQPRRNFSGRPDRQQEKRPPNPPANPNFQIRKPKVVLGQCLICQSNVSDEVYALKTSSGKYTHFECMVKTVREKVRQDHPRVRDFRVYYTGNGTFSSVIEKIQKGNMRWEILSKTTLKELEAALEAPNPTDSNS